MTVRLRMPYLGQAANTLYKGTDESVLKATSVADDYIERASDYVPPAVGGISLSLFPSTIDATLTGVIAQLSTGLAGALTWSKLSGSASALSIAASTGAVSISAALGAGNTAVLNARVQNASGDALEKSFTLTGASATPTPTPTPSVFANGTWNDTATWNDADIWKDAA